MVSDNQPGNRVSEAKNAIDPLQIMGIFWLAFGVIVLGATFFIKGTPQVPLIRGVVTNIIAGVLLVGTGIFAMVKARINKKKQVGQ